MERRRYLKRIAGIVTVGLAGCSESGTPDPGTEASPTPSPGPTDTSTEGATGTDTPTDSPTSTPTHTPRSEVAAEVVVGPDASFRFEPSTVEIAAGETVRWIWDSRGHNVKPGDVPSDADWSGTPGERSKTYQSGYTYTHTFEAAGEYGYYCVPHRGQGMTGTVVVE